MVEKQRTQAHHGMPKDLSGGLILRRARREDAEAVAAFNARVHYSSGGIFEQRESHRGVAAGTRDLMSGAHPTCDASDFTRDRGHHDRLHSLLDMPDRAKVLLRGGGV